AEFALYSEYYIKNKRSNVFSEKARIFIIKELKEVFKNFLETSDVADFFRNL
ncbi:unnamed protein product, partial [marine sediment metagenome]